MPNDAENAIYSRLTEAPTFHPSTADLFLEDWALEPGDVVTVQSGNDSYSMPVYSMTLDWRGSPKAVIQSTGNEKREPLPAMKRQQYGAGSGAYEQAKRFRAYMEQYADDFGAQIGMIVEEVEGEYVINSASIVAAINEAGSDVIISADHIYLDGYVTANELSAQIGSFYNANTGTLSASWVTSQGGQFGSLTVGSLYVGVGQSATWQQKTIGGVTIDYLGR